MNLKVDLFKNNFGRKRFFNLIFLIPMRKMLTKISKNHLKEGNRQIVFPAFDYISNEITLDGVFEKKELVTFFKWLNSLAIATKQSVCIDIGANIGNHSLYFSDYYQKVYSFEPSEKIFDVLSLNSKLVDNIECFNFGCSNRNETALLTSISTNRAGSSISSEEREGEIEKIKVKTLDATLQDLSNIGLIKIDVEGHEFEVLEGAEKTIKSNMPIILFEQHENDFSDNSSPSIEFLKKMGYKDFAILKKYPRVKGNFLKQLIFNPMLVLLFGDQTRVELVKNIVPDFYEFIIALPDWFPLKNIEIEK